MRAAECRSSTVSSAARPGATIFGPPEKPAKKCGSMKPVVIRTSWSTKCRLRPAPASSVPRTVPTWRWRRGVEGVVLDDRAQPRGTSAPSICVQLGGRAGAVGAGGDEEGDRPAPQACSSREHRQHAPPGKRPRDVAHRDAHRRAARHHARAGRPAGRRAQRGADGRRLVGQARHVARLDDVRVRADLDAQAAAPVGQLDALHCTASLCTGMPTGAAKLADVVTQTQTRPAATDGDPAGALLEPQPSRALQAAFAAHPGLSAWRRTPSRRNSVDDVALNQRVVFETDHTFSTAARRLGRHQPEADRPLLDVRGPQPAALRGAGRSSDVKEFEFSQNYLMFWDKLERANYFFEAIIDTADRDVDDRSVAFLLDGPLVRRRAVEHVHQPGAASTASCRRRACPRRTARRTRGA